MLNSTIHDDLLAYTDRELEILQANYKFIHKFKNHMERKFFKDNYIYIEKQTRFAKIPLHSHGFIELIYIYQGEMKQNVNELPLTLKKGELLLLNQFAKHEIDAAGHDDIIINFIIKIEFFGKLMSLFDEENIISDFILSSINGKMRYGEHIHFKVGDIESIQTIMHVIISEIYSKNNLKEVRVNFLVGLLITELISNVESSDYHVNGSYNESLSMSVLKYIDENYSTASLKEISDRLKQPNYKVSKLLKAFTGKNFSELLIEKRIDVLIHLLKHTNHSIIDIINMTGYENASHCYKIFKEKHSMSIKEYRDRNM
ncbi:AraC family transcriptional regulator [Pectobacterium polaris]|uniref:AraC family transcriptional regulator n=1 Tax=Pectobacterium polaris TaxID=2042057 RepID=UPI001CC4754C|nr:AraC family transcriptional regulator [Pectobacterium polaris]UAY90479.1 AraC family transcriptional regulator [Pectobacterium polaris]